MTTQTLYEALFNYNPLPSRLQSTPYAASITAALKQYISIMHHPPRRLLLQAGQVADLLYFVEEGLLRAFYFDETTGRDITFSLWKAEDIVCDPVSFFCRTPAFASIEVLAPSRLQTISLVQLQKVFSSYPEAELFGQCIALHYARLYAERAQDFLNASAWQRYKKLLQYYPGIELVAPRSIIASYLNITPQSLSRLRKRFGHP